MIIPEKQKTVIQYNLRQICKDFQNLDKTGVLQRGLLFELTSEIQNETFHGFSECLTAIREFTYKTLMEYYAKHAI